jgi:hypothetical protein
MGKLFPDILPHKVPEFKVTQSKYPHVPELPMRALIYGPSGSGKTVLLSNFILNVYRGCFSRWFIFSPSIDLDHTWLEVKKYVREEMGVDTEKEKCFFSEYDPVALEAIVKQQFKLATTMKENGKFVYQIGVIVDDFADTPEFTRNSKMLHQLYIRGRHAMISTITSVQKVVTVAPLIRTQATHTFTFRLRSFQDLQIWLDENSAIYDKKTLLKMYHMCIDQPFGFMYINLTTQSRDDMFWYKFEARLVPSGDVRPKQAPVSRGSRAVADEAPVEHVAQ